MQKTRRFVLAVGKSESTARFRRALNSRGRTAIGSDGGQTFIRGAFIVCSPSVLTQDEEGATIISFKGAHFPPEIILMGIRWYVAYPLSYWHVEELMEECGVPVDHATVQRWVEKYSPLLEEAFHRSKRSVWVSWRMDETVRRIGCMEEHSHRLSESLGNSVRTRLTHTR